MPPPRRPRPPARERSSNTHAGPRPSFSTASADMRRPSALRELVEAAARSGEIALAESALARIAERNEVVATDWGLGLEARGRALLNEDKTADGPYGGR